MKPSPHFKQIKIVPMRHCITHEGVVNRWVEHIAHNLLDEGVMKNPIIVTRVGRTHNKWIVIDGMHRFAALRQLEIPHIAVYEIDYQHADSALGGWDALVFRPFHAQTFLRKEFKHGYRIEKVGSAKEAKAAVDTRAALIAATDRRGPFYLLTKGHHATVDQCARTSQKVDMALDAQGYRPLYVPDTLSINDYKKTDASGLVMRTRYTKAEVLERTLEGKLFPRKSTRHMIHGRPLRVDITIAMLRAKISLAAKNRLLKEHLRWCYEADRIRYYPEPVFIFAD